MFVISSRHTFSCVGERTDLRFVLLGFTPRVSKKMVVNVYVSAVTTDNISRHELLAWVNDCLQSNFTKIEEMSTGAAYCQLTHILFPEFINLKKVKWNSRSDMDHLNNWKILGVSWKKVGIDKPVRVEMLMKAKFQDNFEFLQWFYKFFNSNYQESGPYDAVAERGGEPLPAGAKGPGGAARAPARAPAARPAASKPVAPTARVTATKNTSAPKPAATNGSGASAAILAAKDEEIAQLQEKLQEVEEQSQTYAQEREFYYSRLLQLETFCNEAGEDAKIDTAAILAILYQTADDAAEEEVVGAPDGAVADTTAAVAAAELDDSETF